MSDSTPILVEADGPVTTVTFNRPDRMNGITNLMARELHRESTRNQRQTEAYPLWNNYAAEDGKRFWLMGVEADRHWPTLLGLIDRPEWADEPRYATQALRAESSADIIASLDEVFATRPRDGWALSFDAENDFFWAPINTIADVLADPQTRASGAIVDVPHGDSTVAMVAIPVEFHGTPAAPRGMAPLLGKHTDEVLAEVSAQQVAAL